MDGAIDTPSEDFATEDEYGIVIYVKTAIWMYYLEQELGKEKFDSIIHDYYNQWKFKHPYPEDFKAIFQKDAGKDLAPYFDLLNKKANL